MAGDASVASRDHLSSRVPGRAVSADRAEPSAVALQHDGDALGLEEGHLLLGLQRVGVDDCPGRRPRRRDHRLLDLPELLFGAAGRACRERGEVDRGGRGGQHRHPLQLSSVLLQVRLHLEVGDDGLRHGLSVRARGPGERVADHRLVVGFEQVQRDVLVVPRDPVVHERVDDGIDQADPLHLGLRPGLRALHVVGQRQPGAEHVAHVGRQVHDARALQPLLADHRDGRPVHAGRLRRRQARATRRGGRR